MPDGTGENDTDADAGVEPTPEMELQIWSVGQLNRQIRELIDHAIHAHLQDADIPPDEVKRILKQHLDGVDYYYDDFLRYNAQQRQGGVTEDGENP